jgi:hypothetical protein
MKESMSQLMRLEAEGGMERLPIGGDNLMTFRCGCTPRILLLSEALGQNGIRNVQGHGECL